MEVRVSDVVSPRVQKDFMACRVALADKLIKFVEPLVNKRIEQKVQDLKEGQSTKQELRKTIKERREEAKKLLFQLKKEQEVSELLKLVDALVKTGVVYGQTKRNVTSLLERLETLNMKQLVKAKKTVQSMLRKHTTKEEFV